VELFGPQAIWGRELRHYRQTAGLTQARLSELIHFSESLISGVETGQTPASPEFAAACDDALNTGGALLRTLDWRKGQRFPSWFNWPRYEAEATALRTFELSVVYGLLQTEDYARALLDDDTAVSARMERQSILTREDPPPPLLVVLIDESVLSRRVGDSKVMRDQLEHLVTSVSKRVSIQVVPAEAHDGISGSFVVATLSDRSEVAYVETATRGMTTGDRNDINILTESFASIQSRALPVDMSIDLIARTAAHKWT
jgi:transcriptional regulator with XRE-family HTH domain